MATRSQSFLGVGVGLRACHYRDFLQYKPAVDWLEIHTENYLQPGGWDRHVLFRLRADYPLSLHGVGLGLGSAQGFDVGHLQRIAQLVHEVQPALVSEHLCWGAVADRQLNDLLPLPLSRQALDLLCQRVDRVQNTLQRTILLENVSTYVRYRADGMSETQFLVELAQRTGCGILLDVNNLFVNQCNHQESALEAIACVPPHLVGEIHLAGHLVTPDAVVDDHGDKVATPVWDLYGAALQRFGAVSTLIEWDTNLPPLPVLLGEASKARALMQDGALLQLPTDLPLMTQHPLSAPLCIAAFRELQDSPGATPEPRNTDRWRDDLGFIQSNFSKALFSSGSPDCFIGEAGLSQSRFARYRGNLAAHWERTLVGAYPVLQQLVGEEFFAALARAYGHAYASNDADLNQFGVRFPHFLAEFQPVSEYPYFPDMARLEWALHRAYYAGDGVDLELQQLTMLTPEQLDEACFSLQPACTLLHSPWAIVDIWQAHQPGVGGADVDASSEISLPNDLHQACHALVCRPVWKPQVWALTPAEHGLLTNLAAGQTFGSALDSALELDPEFNVAAHLHQWLTLRLLQAPAPTL